MSTNRRLAAILAADVVGYSRMMGSDEAGTLTALKRHRETVFDPIVARHGGRIFKLMGDGTLVEFASVVDAVRCALAIQTAAAEAGGPDASRIVLRIGINLGDVIAEGDDVYGDGVNVAARLEPLAAPGGICIASIVNESIGNRIDGPFNDAGEVSVKNIERPIRVWKWSPGGQGSRPPAAGEAEAKPAAETPSIAVLPFVNMSGDAEQEYFSDGITEDIITDLSKVGSLLVIARNSSFAFKGAHVDIRKVGRDLGVRSVLEGSIRRAGNRVRITAQLIDAANGSHLWAERYDRDLTDIFAVQDEVTRQIVDALKVKLTSGEQARLADAAATRNIEAHDLVLRGRALLFGPKKNRSIFEQTVAFFKQAIERDPEYAEAYAGLSLAYSFDYQNRWTDDPDRSLIESERLARLAVDKAPNEAFSHFVNAIVATFRKDFVRWKAEAETALALNPNFAPAHNILGSIHIYSAEPLAAVPYMEKAIRLDPGFSQQYLHFLGLAYLLAAKYEMAAAVFRERILQVPDTDTTRVMLAATLGHLGQTEEARRLWQELKAINPRYSFAEHIARLPFRDPKDSEPIRSGLAKSGLPD